MSPITLDVLISEHPEIKRALRRLDEWMRKSKDNVIYPSTLVKEVRDVDAGELAAALTLLVQAGLLQRVYKVLTPSGVYADGEFEDPTKIPEKLPDRRENYFDTAESDVVPIFKKVA